MVPFSDTHCHLDFDNFSKDRNQVLNRAWNANVVWILNPGIDLHTNQAAINLASNHPPRISAAVGIHPNFGAPWTADILPTLREQAQHQGVVAIGEIGLDYYRQHTPFTQQRIMFEAQLKMAADLSLPVIIHNREATEDLIPILKTWHNSLIEKQNSLAGRPGVLHSYSDDLTTAEMALEMNFFIGVGGPVTFKNALEHKSVIKNLPLDCLLLETDAPFLTPHPHRGKRNEPAYIPLIAEEIAQLHNTNTSNVAEITWANAQRLFNLDFQ